MPWRDSGRGRGTEETGSGVFMRKRVLSSQKGVPGGLLATDVGAVEYPLDSSEEKELPKEAPYGEPGDARDTHDMEAFPPLLRLCDRGLPRVAKLGEEPMRCRPLRKRCRPLSFGRSIMMASVGGVPGDGGDKSFECSTTTESMERGSMSTMGVGRDLYGSYR